jgi:hypothetical protein
MKKSAVLIPIVLALVACTKPEKPTPPTPIPPAPSTGTLRITLVPEWEGQPLQFFTEYRNFMDYRTTVELVKVYFGNISMVEGTDTLLVKDVALFDLADDATVDIPVPEGAWSTVHAMLGVPAELNYADPALYGVDHPLSVSNGTYWTWATGYRYVMFEGRYDPDPQSTATLMSAYAMHPGMEPSLVEFGLSPSAGITIVKGQTTELQVRVAVDRFFHSDEFQIDLATEHTAHGNNIPLQWKLVNNVVKSMTLE